MRAAAGDGGKERKSGGALVIIDEMVQVKVEYIGWLWSFHLWRDRLWDEGLVWARRQITP